MSIMRFVLMVGLWFALQTGAKGFEAATTWQSDFPVDETVERFEAAVRAKAAAGWTVFGRIDHAAAAEKVGLQLLPRTLVLFGNPRSGTPAMALRGSLGVDLPMKALVWRDEQGSVWLTYNTAADMADIYARHSAKLSDDTKMTLAKFLSELVEQSTKRP
jgi:uncharacterized protein (DUF302 family)